MATKSHHYLALIICLISLGSARADDDDLSGHPRPSYEKVEDIDAMAKALRHALANRDTYSFSRGWWTWDRLRCRYVDEGRKSPSELKILAAAFRGLILDWHAKLEAKGEGDLLYLFFTTVSGDKRERVLDIDNRILKRDVHGGGYHGSWGGAARMRIYEELVTQDVLTEAEQARFKQIVHQSLETRFIDFRAKTQSANNHSFGNGGGIAPWLEAITHGVHVAVRADARVSEKIPCTAAGFSRLEDHETLIGALSP